MFVEYICLLLVCRDGAVVVCEDSLVRVWLSQCLSLNPPMSSNSLEGLVLKEMVSSVCFHLFSCMRFISSFVSLFLV